MTLHDKTFTLTFDHADAGLTTRDGRPAQGFLVSPDGQKWFWAYGRIDGDRVTVRHHSKPTMIRYAWGEDVRWANLTSADGLPVAPFRTDSLLRQTQDER